MQIFNRNLASISLILSVTGLILIGIGQAGAGEVSVHDAADAWDRLFTAMIDADTAAVYALFAPESRPYCEPSERDFRWYRSRTELIGRVEHHDGYTRLVLPDSSECNASSPRDFYLVERDGRLMFQLPFVLFAADWPVETSQHFRLHTDPESEGRPVIDTATLERFVTFVDSLTGLLPLTPIDYYLCHDSATASLLTGAPHEAFGLYGPCIVTWQYAGLSSSGSIILDGRLPRFDLLRVGMISYAFHLADPPDPELSSGRDSMTARCLAGISPDTLDMIMRNDVVGYGLGSIGYVVPQIVTGTAMVMYLAEEFGMERFRELYRRSADAATFTAALEDLYGTTPTKLVALLRGKYEERLRH